MKIAVISFDVKYIESLKQQMPNIELIPYSDTISFLKESEVTKPDIVIYDTTSGIFAEDDLRYLLGKSVVKDKKIFGLVSADNIVDKSFFENRVLFFNKTEDLNKLISTIQSLAQVSQQHEPEIESFKQQEVVIDELKSKEFVSSSFLKFDNLNEVSESVSIKQPSLEIESFDIETDKDIFNDQKFQVQSELENDVLDYSQPASYTEDLEIEDIPLELETFHSTPETTLTDMMQHDEYIYPVESELTHTETKKQERDIEYIKDVEAPQESTSEKKLILGGKSMVANFNIQISEDEIKKMALQVAREFLEKDPAMEKIIDHLQIDFQEEARRELDNIKNEIKNKLKREAEIMMMREIQRLIKEELKDYVADITARIVKEKLEQIFRSF